MQKLKPQEETGGDDTLNCSCRQDPCPLEGYCGTKDIVYKAVIEDTPVPYFYLGSISSQFIKRFRFHKSSMKHRDSRNHTSLSKKVWQLRDQGFSPKVKFSIFLKSNSASTCAKRCNLCISEKKSILVENSPNLLNRRAEIFSKCRHRERWKLCKVT